LTGAINFILFSNKFNALSVAYSTHENVFNVAWFLHVLYLKQSNDVSLILGGNDISYVSLEISVQYFVLDMYYVANGLMAMVNFSNDECYKRNSN